MSGKGLVGVRGLLGCLGGAWEVSGGVSEVCGSGLEVSGRPSRQIQTPLRPSSDPHQTPT